MKSDKENSISLTEVDKNFSLATKIANAKGSAIITEDDNPRYMLIDIQHSPYIELSDEEKIDIVANRILKRYRRAFEELAK